MNQKKALSYSIIKIANIELSQLLLLQMKLYWLNCTLIWWFENAKESAFLPINLGDY
jgi:hypothetical protein